MSISMRFVSSLTDSGQLSVEVPKLAKPLESGGRSIPIEQIGEKDGMPDEIHDTGNGQSVSPSKVLRIRAPLTGVLHPSGVLHGKKFDLQRRRRLQREQM
ncbi:hypothetical protein KIN20_018790, partial [Parelaphostrongylus tenuis]